MLRIGLALGIGLEFGLGLEQELRAIAGLGWRGVVGSAITTLDKKAREGLVW